MPADASAHVQSKFCALETYEIRVSFGQWEALTKVPYGLPLHGQDVLSRCPIVDFPELESWKRNIFHKKKERKLHSFLCGVLFFQEIYLEIWKLLSAFPSILQW